MKRTFVHVATMRILDLAIGDVVNHDPAAFHGWFVVEEIRRLPDGDINVTNRSSRSSMVGAPHDMVGVQVSEVREHQHAAAPRLDAGSPTAASRGLPRLGSERPSARALAPPVGVTEWVDDGRETVREEPRWPTTTRVGDRLARPVP